MTEPTVPSGAPPPTPLEDFVKARSGALCAAAFLLTGDRGFAKDLVQEALARTWRSWKRLHRVQNAEDGETRDGESAGGFEDSAESSGGGEDVDPRLEVLVGTWEADYEDVGPHGSRLVIRDDGAAEFSGAVNLHGAYEGAIFLGDARPHRFEGVEPETGGDRHGVRLRRRGRHAHARLPRRRKPRALQKVMVRRFRYRFADTIEAAVLQDEGQRLRVLRDRT